MPSGLTDFGEEHRTRILLVRVVDRPNLHALNGTGLDIAPLPRQRRLVPSLASTGIGATHKGEDAAAMIDRRMNLFEGSL